MGYNAYTVDTDFTVPAEKVAEALAELNASVTNNPEDDQPYTSLAEAVDEHGGFEGSEDPDGPNSEFTLGWYTNDKYRDEYVLPVLQPLAPYAREGSYVRFNGEDDCLFGFRVVNGRLLEESGSTKWEVVPDRAMTEELENARITKTTITFTVLHRTDEPLSDDLAAVLEETDTGNAVGQETRTTERVPEHAVRAELVALGNDGEFFDEDADPLFPDGNRPEGFNEITGTAPGLELDE